MGRQEHIQFHSPELPRPIKCSPSHQYTFQFSFWNRPDWPPPWLGHLPIHVNILEIAVLFSFLLIPTDERLTKLKWLPLWPKFGKIMKSLLSLTTGSYEFMKGYLKNVTFQVLKLSVIWNWLKFWSTWALTCNSDQLN